mmetsp:Transcript_18564/g.62918  ORF Transcript_18564/g.62918 Transcript_18564/m.62918 type:complete len:200 (+) Transcript_18564:396-995(+)
MRRRVCLSCASFCLRTSGFTPRDASSCSRGKFTAPKPLNMAAATTPMTERRETECSRWKKRERSRQKPASAAQPPLSLLSSSKESSTGRRTPICHNTHQYSSMMGMLHHTAMMLGSPCCCSADAASMAGMTTFSRTQSMVRLMRQSHSRKARGRRSATSKRMSSKRDPATVKVSRNVSLHSHGHRRDRLVDWKARMWRR